MRTLILAALLSASTCFAGAVHAGDTADIVTKRVMAGYLARPELVDTYFDTVEAVVTASKLSAPMTLEEDGQDLEVKWDRSGWLTGDILRVGILDIIATGYADDSVSGERYRYVVAPTADGKFRVLASGWQQLCGRGANKDKWISERCS